jgi:hypothetical protein
LQNQKQMSLIVDVSFQVEICRFGCPEHCQNPSSYVAREQEVSSSINGDYQSPAPSQYQADAPPTSSYQGAAASPSNYQGGAPPPPAPVNYRQSYQQNGPALPPPPPPPRKRQSPPTPPGRPSPNNKNYQIDPRGKKTSKTPEALPHPLPLQAEEEVRSLESARHRARAADADEVEDGEAKQAGGSGIANFLGLKLPELPTLPSFPSFFGAKKAAEKSDVKIEPSGEAIPISLGVKPKDLDFNEDVSFK